jgi:hypothetical protein
MFPQGLEKGMSRACLVFGSLLVVLDGKKGPGVQGDAQKFLTFPDNIYDGLIPVGLEIAYLEGAELGFS